MTATGCAVGGVRLSHVDAEFLAATIVGRGGTADLRSQLTDVSRAILLRRPPNQVEKIACRVAASAWSRGLEEAADRALDDLEGEARRMLELVGQARAELVRLPAENRFAQRLILCEGVRTAHEAHQLHAALDATEAELREERQERRATLALRSAGRIVAWRGDVPRDELTAAAARVFSALGEQPDLDLAEPSARALAQSVATHERREAVHRAMHELREAARRYRLFREHLDQLLDVEPPDDPAEDDLWVVTVMGALELC